MIEFDKYQGLGNDFILFDQVESNIELFEPRTIRALCNRRYGVGADGVLYFSVEGSSSETEEPGSVRMIYLNSDGSRAETCFNGLRCIGLHALRKKLVRNNEQFIVSTDAGNVQMRVNAATSEVAMKLTTVPSLLPVDIGLNSTSDPLKIRWSFGNSEISGSAISMGNPHFVSWQSGASMETLISAVEENGKYVEESELFAFGTNFEIASIRNEGVIDLAVWERGSGMTLACGSGATATAVVAVLTGKIATDREIEVRQAGGSLFVHVNLRLINDNEIELFDPITVRGKADFVFHGSVNIEQMTL